jgi:hypothetical protein
MSEHNFINSDAKWDAYFERLLREWKYKILKRRKLHLDNYRFNKAIYYWFIVPAAIIQALTGATSIGSLTTNEIVSLVLKIVCAVLSFIALGVMTAGVTLGFQDKATKHKSTADSYESLYDLIKSITQSPLQDRGDPASVMNNLRDIFDDILKNAPPIDIDDVDSLSYNSSTSSVDIPHLEKILIDVDTDTRPLEILLTDTPPSEKIALDPTFKGKALEMITRDINLDVPLGKTTPLSTNVKLHAMRNSKSLQSKKDEDINTILRALEAEMKKDG